MGRPVFYQRIRSQAASVQAKSLISHLMAEIRSRREVSPEEARLIALDAYRFLVRGLVGREPGQVEMPCIDGRGTHLRRARHSQPEKLVVLNVVVDDHVIPPHKR